MATIIGDLVGEAVGGIMGGISRMIAERWENKAKIAEINARTTEYVQRTKIEIAERKRLQRQYEEDTKNELIEIKNKKEQSEREIELQRQKDKNEFDEKMKQMEIIFEETNKELQMKEKDEALKRLTKQLDIYNKRVDSGIDTLTELNMQKSIANGKVLQLTDKLNRFEANKKQALASYSENIGLINAKMSLDRVEDELSAIIQLAAVQEDSISTFLGLVINLIDATMANQEKANYLSSELSVFNDLITRAASGKLTIEHYFGDEDMDIYIPILANEDFNNMNDLICEGNSASAEFNEIMDLINEGLKKKHDAWEKEKKEFESNEENIQNNLKFDKKEPKQKPSFRDKRFLKRVCLNPETWQKDEAVKLAITMKRLNEIAEPLAKFFNKIAVVMDEIDLILDFTNANSSASALTEDQTQALQWLKTQKTPAPVSVTQVVVTNGGGAAAVATGDAGNAGKGEKGGSKVIEDEKSESVCTGSESDSVTGSDSDITNAQDTFSAIVVSGTEDTQNAKMDLIKRFDTKGQSGMIQSEELNKAAIMKVKDISQRIAYKFEGSGFKKNGLMLAKGIERSCMEMVRDIGQIRQSIVLSHSILLMKPANLNNEAAKLWDALNKGIIQIFENAIELGKLSSKFFGFFYKFEESFDYYIASTKDVCVATSMSLMVATEHLQKDVREFSKLNNDFGVKVSELGNKAINCIAMCVKNTTGEKNFETNKKDRERKYKIYMEKKALYDAKELEINANYERYLRKRSQFQMEFANYKLEIDSLTAQKEFDEDVATQTQTTIDKLRAIVY